MSHSQEKIHQIHTCKSSSSRGTLKYNVSPSVYASRCQRSWCVINASKAPTCFHVIVEHKHVIKQLPFWLTHRFDLCPSSRIRDPIHTFWHSCPTKPSCGTAGRNTVVPLLHCVKNEGNVVEKQIDTHQQMVLEEKGKWITEREKESYNRKSKLVNSKSALLPHSSRLLLLVLGVHFHCQFASSLLHTSIKLHPFHSISFGRSHHLIN